MLRITAGEHRGRKLKVPKVTATRPLVERAREGVFNHIGGLIHDALFWDVYAGSGILSLEALSRGARQAVAIELNAKAVRQIRENAELIRVADRLQIHQADAHTLPGNLEPPDVVFFDPPYDDFRKGGTARIKAWALFCGLCAGLRPGGCAIAHTPKGMLTDDELAELPGIERRDYGSASLYWWHKDSEPSEVVS